MFKALALVRVAINMRLFEKLSFNLLLILICFLLCTSSFAKEKNAEEFLKENERLAEKNHYNFVKKAYTGINEVINDIGEIEVSEVLEGSPADLAGIKPGDVLLSVDGVRLTKKMEYFKRVIDRRPGSKIVVSLKRNDKIVKTVIESGSFFFPQFIYILAELVFRDVPIRVAIIIDDIKTYSYIQDSSTNKKVDEMTKSFNNFILASFENIFLKSAQGHKNVTLIDRNKTETILSELKFQHSGLIDEKFQTKLGQSLGATHLLMINLVYFYRQDDAKYTLTMRTIDVASGKLLCSYSAEDSKPYADEATSLYLKYDRNISKVTFLSKEAMDLYGEYVVKDSVDTKTRYDVLVQKVIPRYEYFIRELKKIDPISDDLKRIHSIFCEAADLRIETFRSMKSFFETYDQKYRYEGNIKMNASNEKFQEAADKFKRQYTQ